MEKKRVVILGGGYAGIHAAKRLHKRLKHVREQVEITLIDKNHFHTLMTELHEVAGARVEEESVKVTYDRIFSGKRVTVIKDTIESIDFENQLIRSDDSEYPYDQLLISTGAESADFNIPGIREHAFMLWSLDDAIAIREHVRATVEAASYEKDDLKRQDLMTFAVAGSGFTGVEMIGELIEWLPLLCEEYAVDPSEIRLINVEGLGTILPIMPEKPRKKAARYMEKHGVQIRLNSLIVKADEQGFTLKSGEQIRANTLIWTCGVRGCKFCDELPLTDGKVGRKQVDAFMKSPDHDNVYLAGDGLWYIEDGRPLPQIVEAAEQTAAVAADSMAATICKELGCKVTEPKPFKSRFHGHMVSIGGRYGVSHNVGVSLSGLFAMGIKHVVNVIYLNSICGLNGWWEYLKHEILEIKNNRSFIGGFAAYKEQAYWTTFLRLFLGTMWLIEGIKKVLEGWLVDKTGSYVYWSASDAVSGASAEAATEAVQQFAPPLLAEPLALYTWISETFVSLAPYFFQVMIVLGEIGIGLALIGGLFTFLASAASIALSIMLIMGAMASKEILWYIAAAVVMLGGAGRSFGLDYWVMPWIKKQWVKTPLAKKSYLYMGEPGFTRKQKAGRTARQKR